MEPFRELGWAKWIARSDDVGPYASIDNNQPISGEIYNNYYNFIRIKGGRGEPYILTNQLDREHRPNNNLRLC